MVQWRPLLSWGNIYKENAVNAAYSYTPITTNCLFREQQNADWPSITKHEQQQRSHAPKDKDHGADDGGGRQGGGFWGDGVWGTHKV